MATADKLARLEKDIIYWEGLINLSDDESQKSMYQNTLNSIKVEYDDLVAKTREVNPHYEAGGRTTAPTEGRVSKGSVAQGGSKVT